MIGTRIGKYEIKNVIGTGTVGTIYRSIDTETEQTVALKILLPTVSHDPNIRARFRREIAIMQRLQHPNIVEYYDHGDYEGQLYYTMELVDSGSLKEILEKYGAMAWEETAEVGWQICSALQHAHNNGVVHRDLKPSNLFLDSKSYLIKLGDFGIALDMRAGQLTASGMTVGSYAYMSPEQIRGEATVSFQTDLYALGCLLFEMLTGHPPYQAENFPELFDLHLKAKPPKVRREVPTCPPSMEAIIHQLMAKNPEERPFNAREVQGMLSEVVMPTEEIVRHENEAIRATRGRRYREQVLSDMFRPRYARHEMEMSWGRMLAVLGTLAVVVVVLWFVQR